MIRNMVASIRGVYWDGGKIARIRSAAVISGKWVPVHTKQNVAPVTCTAWVCVRSVVLFSKRVSPLSLEVRVVAINDAIK